MTKNFLLLASVVGLLGAALLGSDLVKIYSMPTGQMAELDREETDCEETPLSSHEERTQRMSRRLDLDSRWFEQLMVNRRPLRDRQSEPIAKANTDNPHGAEQIAKLDIEST